jgi:hypothetical protein
MVGSLEQIYIIPEFRIILRTYLSDSFLYYGNLTAPLSGKRFVDMPFTLHGVVLFHVAKIFLELAAGRNDLASLVYDLLKARHNSLRHSLCSFMNIDSGNSLPYIIGQGSYPVAQTGQY